MRAWRCGARRGAAQQHTAVRHLVHAHNRHARAQVGDKSDERACKQIETKAETQRSRDRGREEGQEGEENTCSHQPSPSKIKTMYKLRPPARTQGRMASSSSLPPSRSLLSLSLFAFGQQRDHQPVDSRQKPTIPPENGRKKVGKKTDKPRGHAHTKVYCQQMVQCTVSQWSLSQFGKHTLRVCVCVCGGWGFYQGISRVFYFHFGNKAVSQTDR